jgi:phenylacetate-CoA ligase
MGSTLKFLIDKQPKFIKKISYKLIPFKYRYGKKYNEFVKLINDSKKWSYDETINYQLNKTKELLKYCDQYVPYYNTIFKKNGFNINIKTLSELNNLPILTKEIIYNNFDDLISLNFLKKKYKMNTSGSTGKRLTILGTDDLFKIECAFIDNAYMDQGVSLYSNHSVWIRRYSPSDGDPIFFRDDELNRSYMSAFHLNDETIFSYVDYINKCKTKLLVSYPSTIYYLALLCQKYNLKLPYIKFIHGASEMCLPKWKEVIFNTFGINMKMHYGQVEKVSFAHQDNYDDIYKENLLYGYNEFDENNTIIGTGFYNQLMPLIRYKTNDVVKLNENVKLDNSTPKTILEILGRNGDMLISEKDSMVPAVNFYSFMSKIEEVDLFQIIQVKETKDINFYIVPNLKFTNDSENRLLIEMKNRLGNVNIKIIKVDSLVRDKISNKLKTISLI